MTDIAGWVALAATCVAALMTASNLSARVTGWGFAIFTVGAAAWVIVALATGQTQLLWSNILLGAVDVFGIWRWLGRRAQISDTVQAEAESSVSRVGTALFSMAQLDDVPVRTRDGEVVARAVDAFASCRGGIVHYLIVRVGGLGGVGETLRRLPIHHAVIKEGEILTGLARSDFDGLEGASSG